ncbi:hypothetical protein SAMN05216178_6966 [Pseudomonas saponiphila]|uniref:Uncharacterized protein n=1 Tax=Pseudomonas saponiphila TaxID=556534 RepID=A0A1H5A383_9PSED|nr:hypothetical protein SAMN05216178_6966 [Pseudomonas saponiphila]
MVNQIALNPGVELAEIDGITSITVEGEKIRIVFADGVEASVGRSDLNPNKFDIFFPNPNHVPGENMAGSFMLLLTGDAVVKQVNELAAKAAKTN